ncbi:hypothetical protein [Spirosoma jeollabukense]
MKALSIALLISAGLALQSCQDSSQTVDERPAIKSVSFVGIPTKDVRFDAANSRITVQLPAILKGGLQPIFDLTDGASVLDGVMADNTIDLTRFCYCGQSHNSAQEKEITLRIGNKTTTTVYKVNVVATGVLKAQDSNEEFTFSRKTKLLELNLPVENLYTNPSITDLVFTNVATGKGTRINADAACLNTCSSTAPNQLVFKLSSPIESYLTAGTYTMAIANGISFPQRLIVTD